MSSFTSKVNQTYKKTYSQGNIVTILLSTHNFCFHSLFCSIPFSFLFLCDFYELSFLNSKAQLIIFIVGQFMRSSSNSFFDISQSLDCYIYFERVNIAA